MALQRLCCCHHAVPSGSRPARCQLGDLVPRANPFPKGFLFSSFSCRLWMGPGWLSSCLWAEFWGQQGVLVLLSHAPPQRPKSQPCAQEQSNGTVAWQGSTHPEATDGDGAALTPHPVVAGFGGNLGAAMEGRDGLGVPLAQGPAWGQGRQLFGCSTGWAGKGGGGCVLPRRTVLWIQLPWKLRCCPRCC